MPTRTTYMTLAAAALLIAVGGPVLAARTMTVAQRGLELDMKSATLARGDRILFANQDDVMHDIHIFGPGEDEDVDLGLEKPGATITYKFDKSGLFMVRCNIHPSIKMSVEVK